MPTSITRFVGIISALFLCLILGGCSGLDDLRIVNNYSFPIQLLYEKQVFGTVAPGKSDTFYGKAGYKGDGIRSIEYADAQGKNLGPLPLSRQNVEQEFFGHRSGTCTWVITLGSQAAAKPVWKLTENKSIWKDIGWSLFSGGCTLLALFGVREVRRLFHIVGTGASYFACFLILGINILVLISFPSELMFRIVLGTSLGSIFGFAGPTKTPRRITRRR